MLLKRHFLATVFVLKSFPISLLIDNYVLHQKYFDTLAPNVIYGLSSQLGKLLGCVIGLKNSVTGITIIAIGTSLPDTFASRSAALQDIGADASIGNITGNM